MKERVRSRTVRRWLVLLIWTGLLLGFWLYASRQAGGPGQILSQWLEALSRNPAALLVLVAIYLVRPLLLLPMTALTVFVGFLLGAVWGTLFALVMVLLSATTAYLLARWLGPRRPPEGSLATGFRTRAFEAVLIARLTFIPGDLVNYTAGIVAIPFGSFALATALGGLPGLLMGVLAGAAIEGAFSFSGLRLNPWFLLASGLLLLGSLSLSSYLRRRRAKK